MAYQVAAGNNAFPSGALAAHNKTHRQAWSSGPSHYDGPEFNSSLVEQVPPAAPTTLAGAVDAANTCKALYNDHCSRGNGGTGEKVYAHKTADAANLVTTADMSAGSTYEATILASLQTLVGELRTDYAAHIADAAAHAAADTTHVLGGAPALSSFADLAVELNNLKAQYNAHIAFSAGGSPHLAADSANGVSTANAVSTDLDTIITLANALRTKYNLHRVESGVHAADDTTNVVSGSAVSYPAGLFSLANEIKGDYNTHRASTTYHDVADSTNSISASDATTIASLITLVAELCTDLTAHFRSAPTSAALRAL